MSDETTIPPALSEAEWAMEADRTQGQTWKRIQHFALYGMRHQAAALCLHGQPFGFTHEDVASLRAVLDMAYEAFGGNVVGTDADPDVQRTRVTLAKLAALLPREP